MKSIKSYRHYFHVVDTNVDGDIICQESNNLTAHILRTHYTYLAEYIKQLDVCYCIIIGIRFLLAAGGVNVGYWQQS